MTFNPIQRSEKVRASTFNQRFQAMEDRINNFNPSQDVLVDWTVLASPLSRIEISAIPPGYPALLLLARTKCGNSGFLRFNNDSTAGNYKDQTVQNFGGSLFLEGIGYFRVVSTSGNFAIWRFLLVNYTATVVNLLGKSVGADSGSGIYHANSAGQYLNGPITSIQIDGLSNHAVGTAYALYGLKS
ncbi:MAG: hypothetical protein E6Q97_12175 [Desulfurellales bacterium]|nr:MAG: hypothetical protein E6Q97_12175 [Desulfurellales bacterium]